MPPSDYSVFHALGGGVLIGLASLIASAATGKIPGISGVLSRILRAKSGDTAWRIIFLAGLIAGSALTFRLVDAASLYRPMRSLAVMAFAGILVGLGTRLGGGCTSGHGVCGIGLGDKSSILATLLFMAAAMATVFVYHHATGAASP